MPFKNNNTQTNEEWKNTTLEYIDLVLNQFVAFRKVQIQYDYKAQNLENVTDVDSSTTFSGHLM